MDKIKQMTRDCVKLMTPEQVKIEELEAKIELLENRIKRLENDRGNQ